VSEKDKELQIKFSADVKGLLTGMKDSQDAVKMATEGIKGDLGSAIEAFEKMGSVAVFMGAAGLALEALHGGFSWVSEAVTSTFELAEGFKKLGYETGASLTEMNQYTAAIELSGGSTETLQGLMVGMQRGIKANSEALIDNGVAANKAALQGMTFEQYLTRVHEIADEMATPTEREQFLILALGRAGATAGPMLNEFIENMKKGEGAHIITPESLKNMEESKESIGRLKIAQQEYAAEVSAEATPIANFFRDMHTAYLQAEIDHQAMLKYQREELSGAKYNEGTTDKGREEMHAKGMSGGGEAKKHLIDPEVLKADAAERIALAKGTAEEIAKAALDGIQVQLKAEKSVADQGQISFEEQITLERQHAAEVFQIAQDRAAKETALEAGKPLELQKTNAELAAAQRQFNATTSDLDNQQAQMRINVERETDREMAKLRDQEARESAAVARIAAHEQLAASKDAINEQKRDLDQKVAFGQISAKQELDQRIAFIQQEEAATKKQLLDELTDQSLTVVQKASINAQIVDLERKTTAQINDIKRDAAQKQHDADMANLQGMEAGWSQGIQKMLAGQMTLSQGLKAGLGSMANYWADYWIKQGLDEVNHLAISLVRHQATDAAKSGSAASAAAAQTTAAATSTVVIDNAAALSAMVRIADSAAVAEAAAYAAYIGIPIVGPELAAAAAAAAGATTMGFMGGIALASAAGGWDRVPSDQLAMIHKNEMVLPAPLAQSVRDMAGGGGVGSTEIHFHGVTDASWWSHNQGQIIGQVREAMRNGRLK